MAAGSRARHRWSQGAACFHARPTSDRSRHQFRYPNGEFAEHWAHEISIIPAETWPLLRYRRETDRVRPWGFEKVLEERAEYAAWVLEEVRRRGPLAADELPAPDGTDGRVPGAWIGTVQRGVLEAHFLRGRLAAHGRRSDFSRLYDLAERLIPAGHLGRHVEYGEAKRALLLQAARAHGVGTAKDLADYFRMPVSDAKPRLRELVEAGQLQEARVEGWREMAYLDPRAKMPRKIEAAALLSPFDPLIWTRQRVERLFGFEYRVEIFVPPEKRKYGFYVLPFLFGEKLAARVDLKADRANARLRVLGKWFEGRKTAAVADALAAELRTLGEWLKLKVI
ncbi:MAG TPA: crosslink repair DNA glycosylase YcaQ family protein [Candidatus Sulfopaludibacter sp.]|nr:crosslink repair DNA glycosylase YcaQ family protein [Candidatus Sulfopaludibacter sp.]